MRAIRVREPRHVRRGFALAVPLALLASPAGADTLVTKDGRVIEVKKAREEGEAFKLVLSSGEIVVPKEQVASVEIEGDMSDYFPKDDKEREFLAKGYVRHKGRWMSKAGYEVELSKAAEARRERTEELARRSQFANGWEVESKHFRFKSNTSPEILKRYVDLIEGYYALMDSRIGIKPSPTLARTKMQVNIFRRQQEMIEHAGDKDIDESVLGYFSSWDQALNLYHDYKDPSRSEATTLHECTHLLTYLIDPDYLAQIWINEAVADYFGSCEVTSAKGKLELLPGQIDEDSILSVQQAIAGEALIPLDQLFLTDRDDYDGLHYAHGWSFVYFVQNTPKYAKAFNRFFKDLYGLDLKESKAETLNTGSGDKSGLRKRYPAADIRDALLKRLGVKDIAALQEEWTEFVQATPIESSRASFLRGYQALATGEDSKRALSDFDAAITGGYTRPEAYWARAHARMRTDDRKGALEDFRHAVELEPLNAVFRAELGWGLTLWWGAESKGIQGSQEERDEALEQFGLASELDPENDELVELYQLFVAAHEGQ